MKYLTHRAVLASLAALAALLVALDVADLTTLALIPWAVLTVIAVRQAVRDAHA